MEGKSKKVLIIVVIILSVILIGTIVALVITNVNRISTKGQVEDNGQVSDKIDNSHKVTSSVDLDNEGVIDDNLNKETNNEEKSQKETGQNIDASDTSTNNSLSNFSTNTPKYVDLGNYGPKVVRLRNFESGYIKCQKAEAYIYGDKVQIHIVKSLNQSDYKDLIISDYSGKCIDVLYHHFMGSSNARDLYLLLDDGTIDKYTIPYENYNIDDVKFVRVGKLDNVSNVVAIGQYFNKNIPYAMKSDGTILVNFESGRNASDYGPTAIELFNFEYNDFKCEKAEALVYDDRVEIHIIEDLRENKDKTITISDYSGKCLDVIYRHFSGSANIRDIYLLLDDGTVDMYSMNSEGKHDINKVEFTRKGKLDIKNVVQIGISLNKNVPYAVFSDGTCQVPLTSTVK